MMVMVVDQGSGVGILLADQSALEVTRCPTHYGQATGPHSSCQRGLLLGLLMLLLHLRGYSSGIG